MPEPHHDRRRKAVLVVDDSPDQLELMAEVLQLDGQTVLRAHDGREALKLAARHPVCLILLDLSMPVMSGWEFLEERKRRPELAEVPVVVVSAYASPRPREVDGLLRKPIELDRLLQLVHRYC